MVHLNIFSPTRKLRFISQLILRASRRILRHTGGSSLHIPDPSHMTPRTLNVSYLIKTDWFNALQDDLIHDKKYYEPDSEGGFCIFRVENTLFKVIHYTVFISFRLFSFLSRSIGVISYASHRRLRICLVFQLSMEAAKGNRTTRQSLYSILSSSFVTYFGYYMQCTSYQEFELRIECWVYLTQNHRPSQLYSTTEADSPSLERLLNIVELTNKYCIASYEAWALDRILFLSQNPLGFLRHAPSAVCARVLNLTILCHHQRLLDTITQQLVSRMLWSDMDREPILRVAENRGIQKLQGVAYYKELVELEKSTYYGRGDTRLVLPLSMSVEKRTGFVAAHRSLVRLGESIRMTPPAFISTSCLAHEACVDTWIGLWRDAGAATQTLGHSPADVLGRMKSMMIHLKKSMIGSNTVTLNCALAALEAITTTRDDVITRLIDHFQGS